MFDVEPLSTEALPSRRKIVSRFSSGKKSPHNVVNRPNSSSIVRKINFENEQDTLTLAQENIISSPVSYVPCPNFKDIVVDYKKYISSNNQSSIAVEGKLSSGNKLALLPTSKNNNSTFFNNEKGRFFDNDNSPVLLPKAKNKNKNDKNNKFADLTENDTYINGLIHQNKLLDFSDVLDDDNDNNLDFVPIQTIKTIKQSRFNTKPNLPDDEITLPKKSVKFGQKKKNDLNNSINTLYIEEAISKQQVMNLTDEEDECVTKADFDPDFESEHSAILPPKNTIFNDLNIQIRYDLNDFKIILRTLYKGIFNSMSADLKKRTNNNIQFIDSISNRINIKQIQSVINENIIRLFEERSIHELLNNIYSIQQNQSLLIQQVDHLIQNLEITLDSASQELNRPKGTINSVMDLIEKIKQSKKQEIEEKHKEKYLALKSIIPFRVHSIFQNSNQNSLSKFNNGEEDATVKCTYRAMTNTFKIKSSDILHTKVSAFQRTRNLKDEVQYLMGIVPELFFDGSKFSCVISSIDKQIRFAIVIDVPSFYPWCYLTLDSLRIDFGGNHDDIKREIENILNSMEISQNPMTFLIESLLNKYT